MIDPQKLNYIHGGQKRRKLALCLGALERDILGIAERGHEYAFHVLPRAGYLKKIISIVLDDPALPPAAADEIHALSAAEPFDELRVCNTARNHLLALIGTFPAEWDLIIAPHKTSRKAALGETRVIPGVMIYAEDIRSPFNLGSIFRTAEAFGAEKIFLSPFCCPVEHPRTARSAMGCEKTIPYERIPLEAIPDDIPVFVLETGGTPIGEFVFPKRGVLIVGNEELGVSPQALSRADAGCVSIPLNGLKASLNVGVAFGIALNAWISFLTANQL